MYYSDYKKDSSTFVKRVKFLQKYLNSQGIDCIFKVPETAPILDPDTTYYFNVNMKHNGDHVRGARDLRSTDDNKQNSIVQVKPQHIHVKQTQLRKVVETGTVLKGGLNEKKHLNQTNLSEGHNIQTYFENCLENAKTVRELLHKNVFTPDFTYHHFCAAEERALHLEHNRITQQGLEKGLNDVGLLVYKKCNAAFDNCSNDLERVKIDITEKFSYCQQPDATQSFVKEKAQDISETVVYHGRKVQFLILSFSDKFGETSIPLKHSLNTLLFRQKNQMSEFQRALTPCGITFRSEDKDCFEEYNSTSAILPQAVAYLRTTVKQISLEEIDHLSAALEVDVMENIPAGERKISKNYLPGLTKEK